MGLGSLLDMYLELFDALGITQSMIELCMKWDRGIKQMEVGSLLDIYLVP